MYDGLTCTSNARFCHKLLNRSCWKQSTLDSFKAIFSVFARFCYKWSDGAVFVVGRPFTANLCWKWGTCTTALSQLPSEYQSLKCVFILLFISEMEGQEPEANPDIVAEGI